MLFEFSSVIYKKFLWLAVSGALIWDAINYPFLFMEKYSIPIMLLIITTLGIALKIATLVTLIRNKGPIKILVGIWGALMIIGGIFGFVAIVAAESPQALSVILSKATFIIFGLALVLPLSSSVQSVNNA
jgi:hypothetical protein